MNFLVQVLSRLNIDRLRSRGGGEDVNLSRTPIGYSGLVAGGIHPANGRRGSNLAEVAVHGDPWEAETTTSRTGASMPRCEGHNAVLEPPGGVAPLLEGWVRESSLNPSSRYDGLRVRRWRRVAKRPEPAIPGADYKPRLLTGDSRRRHKEAQALKSAYPARAGAGGSLASELLNPTAAYSA